jgi:phosphatidylserine/phosphatidylglycerophosphate/cardiolipin synthase-like enzyme
MYDFGATHIRDAILAKAGKLKEFVLVMQSGESLGTGPGDDSGTKKDDLPDADIAKSLADAFGDRFHFGWVKLGPKNGWVANSYHIKVAVKDSSAFWLSSGNWQSSNQPKLGALFGSTDFSFLKDYNREWHAIVEHQGLAEIYEAYIRNDLAQGSTPDFVEGLSSLPTISVPKSALFESAPSAQYQYFKPLDVDEQMKVTPLLTPDNYFDAAIELIKSAKTEILLQNQTFNAPAEHQEKLGEFVRLLQKRQSEISVRIVFRLFMPADARRNLEALVEMGFNPEMIRVQPNLHTKGIIVDGAKVLLGSQNISETGISVNRDASLVFEHQKIAEYFRDIFEHDWKYLARKNIGDKFIPAFKVAEGMKVAEGWEMLTPKEYLPLL